MVEVSVWGPLAQLVERGADNAKVVSSSLTWTMFSHIFLMPKNVGKYWITSLGVVIQYFFFSNRMLEVVDGKYGDSFIF